MSLQKDEKRKYRIKYAVAFIVLIIIEVLIALYVHDNFVRPYIGDVLVVIVLYSAIRVIIPEKYVLMPLYLFVFAAGVEFLQYFKLVQALGLQNNTFFRIILGSTFDWMDILCYGVGCVILGVYEWIVRNRKRCQVTVTK
ncbi:ribosomal maturation YjgA family protein [Lachnoclostridium phytofermentans]|uniref:DUF2809 domain-containing protein n=1 Tax=Lachnoclostridium phytofermentans (strain ATCC 700394 / DSM 18823 / ISDg) TaxID=357809 RepID=A9KPK0_LACP7|nr:DUF2809 domain-containing protein [Lachnoclostridium phytofermentans]ABX43274.1 conserved hypothetical protein [Lachnoclostridium phytofermentans ISDg]